MKPTRSGSSRRRPMLSDVDYVLRKLDWMREQHI